MPDYKPVNSVDHVGVAVADADVTAAWYVKELGLSVSHDETVGEIGVRLVYLSPPGRGTAVQLVQPMGPGPVREFLETHGEGMHHLCFAVGDLPHTLRAVTGAGEAAPFTGARGQRCAFLPPAPGGVLIELTEPRQSSERGQQ
jgi:methylmalonyl-CoA/ethylmalonyl-CoA epimerase